jgi:hypothetical protein
MYFSMLQMFSDVKYHNYITPSALQFNFNI